MDEDRIELVASVGALDAVVVALREFLHRSGAVRAVAVVDREPGEGPAVIDCARLMPIEVDYGDRVVHLPHAIELDAEPPALPDVRQLPPFQVDAERGEIAAPLGGVAHLASAVRDPTWKPTLGPNNTTFRMADLLFFAFEGKKTLLAPVG